MFVVIAVLVLKLTFAFLVALIDSTYTTLEAVAGDNVDEPEPQASVVPEKLLVLVNGNVTLNAKDEPDVIEDIAAEI